MGKLSDEDRASFEASQTLSTLRPVVGEIRKSLQLGDYAAVQGALRGMYNILAGTLEKDRLSEVQLSKTSRTRIAGLNAVIYDVRETLVHQVELVGRNVLEAAGVASTHEKLQVVEDLFDLYSRSP